MKILLVEDEPSMGDVLKRKLEIIRGRFPTATVTLVTTFAAAVEAVCALPGPDVTYLDLTLSDSSFEQTLSRIDEIESRSPVIIVTGHPEAKVRAAMDRPEIEVVEKTPSMLEGNILFQALVRALSRGDRQRAFRMQQSMRAMKEIIDSNAQPTSYPQPS